MSNLDNSLFDMMEDINKKEQPKEIEFANVEEIDYFNTDTKSGAHAAEKLIIQNDNQKKNSKITKMTFDLPVSLHEKLKSTCKKRGLTMQFILETSIEEFLNLKEKPELINSFVEEIETKKTTIDLDSHLHKSLKEYRKETGLRMRLVILVVLEKYLKDLGEI